MYRLASDLSAADLQFQPVIITNSLGKLTFFPHADVAAALKTTCLALATHPHIHLTAASVFTHVLSTASDAATKETYVHTHSSVIF